eukprot:CAMPEP_0174931820 /NCGR_PEP_ID=MMETSP1355-20121228/35080_1 /TAXON_ID=464990 /ORGANISM="Hemiselmis tepida, Strain CCMP443" /LENGTH=31 /DNA_ID= /DNA_START= /DNA_END= /DNA_ORIENTATION=
MVNGEPGQGEAAFFAPGASPADKRCPFGSLP